MVTKGTNVLFKFNKVIKIFKKFINPERKILFSQKKEVQRNKKYDTIKTPKKKKEGII